MARTGMASYGQLLLQPPQHEAPSAASAAPQPVNAASAVLVKAEPGLANDGTLVQQIE